MRIGELSQRAAMSRDTIRFYEKNGLIASQPGMDETNNYRDYPDGTLPTLELIQEAQAAGFTIAELKKFIIQIETVGKNNFDGESFLDRKIKEVKTNIERSKRFLRTLEETKRTLDHASQPDD